MTQATRTNSEPQMQFESVTVEIHGAVTPVSQQDANDLARTMGYNSTDLTIHPDGFTETTMGPYRITAGRRRFSVTQQLDPQHVNAERMVRETCVFAAQIAQQARDAVSMVTIHILATIPVSAFRPDVARLMMNMSPESNQLEPTVSREGTRFPVWHRILPLQEDNQGDNQGMTSTYHATAAYSMAYAITATPTDAFLLEEIGAALLEAMDAKATQRQLYITARDLSNVATFDRWVGEFRYEDDDYRWQFLELVADSLTAEVLSMPADELSATVHAARQLARIYEDLVHDHQVSQTVDPDATSNTLLSRIREHNWPKDETQS